MIYLTYNDPPSGIYSGQVIDVCYFLNKNLKARICLVSIISLRNFSKNKSRLKAECPTAIVLPMFPGVKNWGWNFLLLYILFVFVGRQSVIARGPFAASLALRLKKNKMVSAVCFDARGAYDAEFKEYNVSGENKINNDIFAIEKNALLNSDFRLAVSHKLVEYWKEKFEYAKNEHVVIPCTVNSNMMSEERTLHDKRASLGFSDDDIIFVYSGSTAGWQSLKRIDEFLSNIMGGNTRAKALFLTNPLPENMNIMKEYPARVVVKWVKTDEVPDILSCCDYGLLIRENSVTNQVASPVKFAEYLASGLKVLISANIGDYSNFVQLHDCGYVFNAEGIENTFNKLSDDERRYNTDIAKKYFLKINYLKEYTKLRDHLS